MSHGGFLITFRRQCSQNVLQVSKCVLRIIVNTRIFDSNKNYGKAYEILS